LRDESSPRWCVLFVCTHNAAGSEIAEALLARTGRDRFDVASAGSDPALDARLRAIGDLGRR
jgi:protein-tyrosine-phosphatase